MSHQRKPFHTTAIFLFATLLIITLACSRAFQIAATPIANEQTPNANVISTLFPDVKSFTPGDPTATPLGSDITDSNFQKGLAAFDAKNYQETIALMSAVIQSHPELAPPYRYRGLSYWYTNDCQSALKDFDQALSINPEYAAAWAGRGLAHSCFEDWDEALQDYEKALEIDPSLAFIHHNLGVYYYQMGDYEKSLEEYSLTAAIDPNRSSAWAGKAEAYSKLSQYRECITSATKALEIDPEQWLAYTDRGYCAASIGDHQAAIQDYEEFMAHNVADADLWYLLGYSQYHSGLNEESADSYSKTLELDPSYFQANINRGLAYVALEKYQQALDDFNRALEFGDIPFAYSGRGDAYYGLKEYDLAIADYETAISMMQGSASAAHSYCMVSLNYYEVGRYQDALNAGKTGYDLNPSCGGQRVLEIQARSYYALGDYEQAILYMNRTFQLGEYSIGYYYRGIMYHDAGKYEEALSDLNRFLETIQDDTTFQKEIEDARARIAELMP